MSKKKKVVVLGGGLAGLSAAWKLAEANYPVTVIEREKIVGGLAATIKHKGFLFDYGGHRFITKRQEVLDKMQALLGKEFRPGFRKTQYLLWGKFVNYPLELGDVVKKVNPLTSGLCLTNYLWTRLKNKFVDAPEDNFEAWVSKRFGKRLYEIFFGQITRKIWGIPPAKISKDWAAQRISIINLGDAIRQLIFKPKEDPRTYTRKYYYCDYGIGQIAQKMAQKIKRKNGKIIFNAEVFKIMKSGREIKAVKYKNDGQTKTIKGDAFICTMPLTDFILRMKRSPQKKIIDAAKKLRYRAVAFLFMTLDQKKISDNDALYVPEPKYFFFRIEQYKFWSAKMVPSPDKTSLCLEITCFKDDKVWNMPDDEMYRRSIEGLKEANLIKDEKVIKDWFIHRKNYVYPIFELGYQKHAKIIRNYADSISNLIAYGRQGYYQYIHMHHVSAKGFKAADWVMGKTTKEDVQTLGTEEEYFG